MHVSYTTATGGRAKEIKLKWLLRATSSEVTFITTLMSILYICSMRSLLQVLGTPLQTTETNHMAPSRRPSQMPPIFPPGRSNAFRRQLALTLPAQTAPIDSKFRMSNWPIIRSIQRGRMRLQLSSVTCREFRRRRVVPHRTRYETEKLRSLSSSSPSSNRKSEVNGVFHESRQQRPLVTFW